MTFKNRIIGEGIEAPENLLANPSNWRTHPSNQQDALKGVLSEVGFVQRVIVNQRTGYIVDGHARVMIAMRENQKEIPVLYVDLSEAEEKLVLATLDPIGALAGTDTSQLQALLDQVSTDNPDIQALLDQLAAGLPEVVEGTEGLTEDDEAPSVQDKAITCIGDVWILGKHRLMCGDSTSIEAVERLCGDSGIDLFLTDPPYNVAYEGKTKDALTIENDSMSNDAFRQFLRDAFTAADAVMKPGAVFYIWHADSEGYNFRGACFDTGWKVRQCLVWNKDVMVMGRQDYHWKHEPCLYGWKEGSGHLWASDRKQVTILEFKRPTRNAEHPTMKPVALFEYQMLNNTKGQDIVLDLFGGSGTTLIAAEKHGRQARLMELDPKYCDVIVRRWQEFTGKHAILEADGRTFAEVEAG